MAKKAQSIAPKILVVTPFRREFAEASDEVLQVPYDALEKCADSAAVAVLLHPSYDGGPGIGYTQDLIDLIKEKYPHFTAKNIKWEYFGSAIRGTSLLLLGSLRPVKIDHEKLKKTVAKDQFATLLRHAPKNVNLNSLEHALGVRFGFEYSHLHALPEIDLWKNKRLVVEEVIEGRVQPRRLTKEEIGSIYGMESAGEINELKVLTPMVVSDRLVSVITDSMEK